MKNLALSWLFLFGTSSVYADADSIEVQLLAINDFHGNLEPPTGSSGKVGSSEAGGAEHLATHLKNLRVGKPFTLTVSAGDLVGASPLISALFNDEPTIEAMNLMGLDFNGVGNHEFDHGWKALKRLQEGDKTTGFQGAKFDFLAANVLLTTTGKTIFPSYKTRDFGKAKIAFIGIVLEGMDQVATKEATTDLLFFDEAETVNKLVPQLKAEGVKTIVLLIHEGGFPTGSYNECPGISGPIVDIVNSLSSEVSVVVSGHTHQAYNCRINDKLVTSSAYAGKMVTEIKMQFEASSGNFMSAQAENIIVTRTVEKDAAQSALINHYREKAAPIANRPVGFISESLSKGKDMTVESSLGRMLADAQREAIKEEKIDIAFINPGGIRTDISYLSSPTGEGDGKVMYSEAFAVQPFGNKLISFDLKGAHILRLLEQQFAGCEASQTRLLQISESLSYTVNEKAPPCHKVDASKVMLNQKPLDLQHNYRVVANSFLADGGDGFSVFKEGVNRHIDITDLEALINYLSAHSPLHGFKTSRIKFEH